MTNTAAPETTTDESGNYEPESTYRAGDVPTRKLAFRLTRGDVIRHARRTYRVLSVDLLVLYPRNARVSGATVRHAYRVTMVRTVAGRPTGERSIKIDLAETALVTLVTK